MKYVASVDGRDFVMDVDEPGAIVVDGAEVGVDLQLVDGVSLFSLIVERKSYELIVERRDGLYMVLIEGDRYDVDVEDAHLRQLKAMGGQTHEEHGTVSVVAPMPGMVVKVMVRQGDTVEAEQGLVILEAMKMENELRSPRQGVVHVVGVAPGATVALGDVLVVVGDPE